MLFQPPFDRIQENRSSRWSCENLYVSRYLNGLLGKENICDDIAIVDLIQAVKPMTNVLRCELQSNCDVVEAVCNDSRYFAEDKNISSQVSLV